MIGLCWSVLFLAVVSTQNVSVATALCQLNETLKVLIENITAGQTRATVNINVYQKSFQFGVRTCSDAHVLLSNKNLTEPPVDNHVHHIVIGGCNNTVSAIRTDSPEGQVNTVSFNHSFGPLNCDNMTSFCIDWEKKDVIKVGSGLGVDFDEFMFLKVRKSVDINYVLMTTWNNVSGDSVFNYSLSDSCKVTSVAESTTTPIGGTRTTDTQTPAQKTETQSSGCTVTSVAESTTTPIGDTGTTDTQKPPQTTGNTMTSEASAPTVTTGIQQSTLTIKTTETIPANNSICKCPCHLQHNQTEEERATYLRTAIEQIRKELKMEKKNLSSETRKKTSARDERVSAKTMGFTLGVCVLTTVFGSIIIVDLVKLGRFIWKRFL